MIATRFATFRIANATTTSKPPAPKPTGTNSTGTRSGKPVKK